MIRDVGSSWYYDENVYENPAPVMNIFSMKNVHLHSIVVVTTFHQLRPGVL